MPAGRRAGGAAFATPRCSMDAAIGGGNYSYGTIDSLRFVYFV